MGELQDIVGAAIAEMYSEDNFGRPITYTPAGGAAFPTRGIFTDGEDLDDAQWKAALQSSGTLRVMKSDVPVWSQKDTVQINGVTWSVVKKLGSTPADWTFAIRTNLRLTFREK